MSKKAYDLIAFPTLANVGELIRQYADAGWRVHTFVYAPEPGGWVALMERDSEG